LSALLAPAGGAAPRMQSVLERMGQVRSSGAAAEGGSASDAAKLQRLLHMGFDESPARFALHECRGDVQAAIEMLFAGGTGSAGGGGAGGARSVSGGLREVEADLRRQRAAAAAEQRGAPRSGPARAGATAPASVSVSGASAGAQSQSPSKKDKEERSLDKQAERLATAMSETPEAVDMLVLVLRTIAQHPGEAKYREVKTTNARFRDTVGRAGSAGTAMLELAGFSRAGDWHVLRGAAEDPARLFTCRSALEAAQGSARYLLARDRAAFEAALQASVGTAGEEEERRKAALRPRVPAQPEAGRAGTTRVTVFCGEDVLQRRFNSDDVVRDIVHWLGAEHRSVIPDRLLGDRSWELVNKTVYPPHVLELSDKELGQTLMAAEMWPGAELVVQPAGTLERSNNNIV
jgi:hypothetical protein